MILKISTHRSYVSKYILKQIFSLGKILQTLYIYIYILGTVPGYDAWATSVRQDIIYISLKEPYLTSKHAN